MKVIGVTGSSGSGKTTLTKILEQELNAKTIYADELVKKMQQKGQKYYKKIVEQFGKDILDSNGEINRPKLAKIIFEDNEKRMQLNDLTNKYVVAEIKEQIEKLDEEYVIIDAPLLIETGLNAICNKVIAVISNKETQISRIIKRDKIDKEMAIARLEAQKDNNFYKENADYIVENNGEKYDEFVGRVRECLQELQ